MTSPDRDSEKEGSNRWLKHFSTKAQQEIQSILALFHRECQVSVISLSMSDQVTVVRPEARAVVHASPVQIPLPRSYSPLRQWVLSSPAVVAIPTLEGQNQPVYAVPCHWEAMAVKMAPKEIWKQRVSAKEVSLEALNHPRVQAPTVQRLRVVSKSLTPGALAKPITKPLMFSKFRATLKQLVVPKSKTKSQPFTKRYWQLPIVKLPLPTHTLSRIQRQRFREALAKNGNTEMDNVLISRVYSSVAASAYDSMKVDEMGNLMCFPRTKDPLPTGRNSLSKRPFIPTFYLIFGQTLRDKKPLKAFVPLFQPNAEVPLNSEEVG